MQIPKLYLEFHRHSRHARCMIFAVGSATKAFDSLPASIRDIHSLSSTEVRVSIEVKLTLVSNACAFLLQI